MRRKLGQRWLAILLRLQRRRTTLLRLQRREVHDLVVFEFCQTHVSAVSWCRIRTVRVRLQDKRLRALW